MELLLNVDREDKRPLQFQIYETIQSMILSGNLRRGQRLPSTRSISMQLGIARNTVILAFDRLASEGYITTRLKAGVFVNEDLPEVYVLVRNDHASPMVKGQRLRLGRNPSFSGPFFELWKDRTTRPQFDFFVGRPNPDSFPISFWRRSVARHLTYARGIQTEYGDPRGLKALREAIAEHLKATRGINAGTDQVMITAGIQGALNLLARIFLSGPGQSSVAIENPGYQGAAFLFKNYGFKLRPIQVDEHGLKVSQLEGFLGNLVYVTPSHQFPTGYTLSLDRRLHLLDWANRTGSYIIEDDYDSDFRYNGPPLTAVAGLDRKARVIYLGTFSKSIGAGIRIGYAVLPRHLLDQAHTAKALLDLGAPWLEQAVIAEFLKEGAFLRHLKRIRRTYLAKRDSLIDAIERHFPGSVLSGQECGMHMMWTLPPNLPPPEEMRRIELTSGVGLYPLLSAGAYEYGSGRNFRERAIILGYTALSEQAIKEAVGRVAAAMQG